MLITSSVDITSITFEADDIAVATVPEPSALIPLGLGIPAVLGYGWCYHKRATA